jgi:DNA-binding winged helix-turn-helix (wHTH) protein
MPEIRFRPKDRGTFRLGEDTGQLWEGEVPIKVRPKQWQLLKYLAERPGELIMKTKLLDDIWGRDVAVQPQIIDQTLAGLRQRLGDKAKGSRFIETVSGGLKFVADIEVDSQGNSAKVFFNDGWNGFDPSSDADVLFVLKLTVDLYYTRHIEFLRQLKEETYYFDGDPRTDPLGIGAIPEMVLNPLEDIATISVCFGAGPEDVGQSSEDYHYYFRHYRPLVPVGVAVDVVDGNDQAMWVWSIHVPSNWLCPERPYVHRHCVETVRLLVENWIRVHNKEIERIRQTRLVKA